MKQLNILVWHIHGSYLHSLVQVPHRFYLPVKDGRPEGYGGRGATFDWPANAVEVPADEVRHLRLDLVIHQTMKNYLEDQFEILSAEQRRLPKIYLEHNTPKEHPTDALHPLSDGDVLLVHVTHFNAMMWNSGRSRTRVIEHGARVPASVQFSGELERGVVVVNGLKRRQRIAGYDVWQRIYPQVALDLIGMGSEELGGLGDIPHRQLHALEARYRFFFNPIRYTSLPLALVEAMHIGMPVVALATTEVPTVVQNGESGFVSNDLEYLVDGMRMLLQDRALAVRMGQHARRVASQRFSLDRFVRDWNDAFKEVLS